MQRSPGLASPRTWSPGTTPAGSSRVALDDPDGEPDEVERTRLEDAGMLGHLAAEERAPGVATAMGDAPDEIVDLVDVEAPDRDVVEEEERVGPVRREVVDGHRDAVDADRVVAADLVRDDGLRADAVSGRHEQRVVVAELPEVEEAAEAADVTDDAGRGTSSAHGP